MSSAINFFDSLRTFVVDENSRSYELLVKLFIYIGGEGLRALELRFFSGVEFEILYVI